MGCPTSVSKEHYSCCLRSESSLTRTPTPNTMESRPPIYSSATNLKKGYSPPWEDLSIIGIAGSSGSGKTSVAMEIVKSLNLPWVVILVMVHFKPRDVHADKRPRA